MITKDDVLRAQERIAGKVHRTPLLASARLSERTGGRLYFKCESLQRTGSFKARGALNAMLQLTPEQRAAGVVTVSAGNHAQALAWAASQVGTSCIAVMPEGASRAKIAATEGYGGTVEIAMGEKKRAFERAREIADQGRVMVHPFEDEQVAAGQGTVALELLDQLPDVDTVVVPIGGGGLIAGMSVAIKALRPDIQVVGVEPEGSAVMHASVAAGTPQEIAPKSVADGLNAPMVGAMTLAAVRENVDDLVLVTDDDITAALREMLTYAKLVVEPAAAASVAAVLAGKVRAKKGTAIAAVLSGGNVDLDRLKTLL